MARKRLSDLLREEVNKPGEADPPAAQPSRATRRKPSAKSAGDAEPTPAESEQAAPEDPAPNAEVMKLKAGLEQANDREKALQEKIFDLQAEIDGHKAKISSLEASLQQIASLKTELDQVKATALQLAEENSRLIREAETPKSAPAPATKPADSPEPAQKTLAQKTNDPMEARQSAIRQRQERSLAHPIFPNKIPSIVTDQDMGWVD